jgi:hypothetical protein
MEKQHSGVHLASFDIDTVENNNCPGEIKTLFTLYEIWRVPSISNEKFEF